MSNGCWKTRLRTLLTRNERVAVLGIGNELYGDDGVGLHVVRRMPPGALLCVEAGSAPENVLGALRPYQPQAVILVDAAQMDAEPGAVRWIDDVEGLSASSHTLPLSALAEYLSHEYACEVVILGVQPATTGLTSCLSAPVRHALDEIVTALHNGGES